MTQMDFQIEWIFISVLLILFIGVCADLLSRFFNVEKDHMKNEDDSNSRNRY